MSPQPLRRQRGISLIVSLVLLLLVTLVALASVRTVVLQTGMTAASHDRNISFQAAESALRAAEAQAQANGPALVGAAGAGCDAGFCAPPAAAASAPRWLGTVDWANSAVTVSDGAPTPQILVESMGNGPTISGCEKKQPPDIHCLTPRYRVTARAAAPGRADVVVQSEYATE